ETSGQKANENSWIALVQRGLQGIATEYNTAYGSGLRLGDTPSAHAKISENISAAKAAGFDFLLRPAPEEPEPSRPLSPSRTADDDPAAASPLEARRSFSRGRLIHELLQYLPDVVQELQENTAQKLASGYARQMNSEDMQACINEAFAVLRHPELGFLFTQSGLAEVPVTGTVHIKNHPFIVSGQVDRLVLGDAVWIVDYKTGRQPPADVKDTPPAYLRQLALYRALFVEMQPQKPVQCALVWTQAAQITPIPAALLDAALNSTYI
ncbi:MAG: PD-(D/E)XK nuclease family protein, partial [Alphaproteobacteria bacterium]